MKIEPVKQFRVKVVSGYQFDENKEYDVLLLKYDERVQSASNNLSFGIVNDLGGLRFINEIDCKIVSR